MLGEILRSPLVASTVRKARGRVLSLSLRALSRVRTVFGESDDVRADDDPASTGLARFRPFAPSTLEDPHPFYEAVRNEKPVYRVPGADYYLVSRYEDVRTVTLDPETYSSNLVAILLAGGKGGVQSMKLPDLGVGPIDVLALVDPPVHAVHRKLASAAFSQRVQRGLDDDIRSIVTELLDAFVAKGGGDFMHEVAEVLPMRLVLRLVDLDESRHREVKRWCDHAISLLSGVNTPEQFAAHVEQGFALYSFCVREVRRLRREGTSSDLMRAMIDAIEGRSEAKLSEAEAISILLQILIAGSDSAASTMGSAMHHLVRDPALQARLRAEPERLPTFVEEVLRLESPFQGHFRLVTRDTELSGTRLPKGSRVLALWTSANRDAAKFPEPHRLDLDRANARHHMAFGYGPHLCLGAPLARREVAIAMEETLRRTTELGLGEGEVRHRPSVFTRTLEHLPIRARAESPTSARAS